MTSRPTTSTRSWLSLVLEADPEYSSPERIRPREYKFTQREFRQKPGDWYSGAPTVGTST